MGDTTTTFYVSFPLLGTTFSMWLFPFGGTQLYTSVYVYMVVPYIKAGSFVDMYNSFPFTLKKRTPTCFLTYFDEAICLLVLVFNSLSLQWLLLTVLDFQ